VKSTAQHHLEEFIRYISQPVRRNGQTFEWREEAYDFVLAAGKTHLLMCMIYFSAPNDENDALNMLYKRALPQRFMGLPIRIYRDEDWIIGTLAIPENAVTVERLTDLQQSLRNMFDLPL
jgi:hypothetical protein